MYMNLSKKIFNIGVVLILALSLSGCTVIFQKGRRSDIEKVSKLKQELTNLEKAKAELENRLKDEIGDKQVKVEMLERGLVITFVAEVLFDSGKADLKDDSLATINKVADVLQTTVKDLSVGVEGHTDNDPIKHSKWADNWQLSTERALSVVRYLIQTENIDATRLSATGYGEFHPVADNDSKEGRQKNRRVEIVILPKTEKAGRK